MEEDTRELGKVIKIDESRIKGHLDELVRGSVENTLNSLLDAEADNYVAPSVTNVQGRVRTLERGIIRGSFTPKQER